MSHTVTKQKLYKLLNLQEPISLPQLQHSALGFMKNNERGKKFDGESDSPQKSWLNWNVIVEHVLSCFSHVWLLVVLGTVAHQAPLFMGFPRQE